MEADHIKSCPRCSQSAARFHGDVGWEDDPHTLVECLNNSCWFAELYPHLYSGFYIPFTSELPELDFANYPTEYPEAVDKEVMKMLNERKAFLGKSKQVCPTVTVVKASDKWRHEYLKA